MSGADQTPRHVPAHPAEADHRYLHGKSLSADPVAQRIKSRAS